MCGISGYIGILDDTTRISDKDSDSISSAIQSRGPDHHGSLEIKEPGVEAIVDLTTLSNQPYSDNTYKNTLAYNGEIYNCDELVRDYEVPDYYNRSDTLVLYYLLSNYDLKIVLPVIKGMFAFVFYKSDENQYYLARDSLGEKPLYYYTNENSDPNIIIFSSDLSSFYSLDTWKVDIDRQALMQFVDIGYTLDNKTIFTGVKEIQAGSFLSITANKKIHVKEDCYFDLNSFGPDAKLKVTTVKDEIINSVADCIKCDVDVGVFLSGGLDSTLVATLAAKHKPLTAFTVTFDPSDPELITSKNNAQKLGIQHCEIFVNEKDMMNDLEVFLDASTEPLGDDSSFLVDLVAKEAKKLGIKVLLGGDAGDEFFFGYDRMKSGHAIIKKYRMFDFINIPKKKKKNSKLGKLWDINTTSIEEFYVNYFLSSATTNWYRVNKRFDGVLTEKLQKLEVEFYLQKNSFKKLDFNTMRHGVEGRTPLASCDLLKSINFSDMSNADYRRKIFLEIIENEKKNVRPVQYKSGFGIKTSKKILKKFRALNEKDQKLLDFFGTDDLNNEFNLSSFAVNFRLVSFSKFLKNTFRDVRH